MEGRVDASGLLANLADGIAGLAEDLRRLEEILFDLPGSERIFARAARQLQDFDRIAQVLDEYSRLVAGLAAALGDAAEVPADAVFATVRMEEVRARGAGRSHGDAVRAAGEVTWL
ncbi:MAG: hypothetical protein N2422_00060 [Rhodobacteraceae bacterium]|nr:hypothetical protein [Paracoccaceae bacterium]